jgi:dipeptidyl aminopeptidase/acylaminoacyl peptidase
MLGSEDDPLSAERSHAVSAPRFSRKIPIVTILTTLTLALALPVAGLAQPGDSSAGAYQIPPKELVDLIDAPPTPWVSLSPKQSWMLIMERPNLPPIAELAEPELRLAGLRIKPRTNGPSRTRAAIKKITLRSLDGLVERGIKGLPPNAKIGSVRWAPDGNRFAFTVTDDQNIELWVAEAEKENTKRILRQRLNAARGTPYRWLSDSKTLVCAIVPEERGPEPQASRVPKGPVTQENIAKKAPARTYQDLLKNAHDEDLFDHYFTAQLFRVDLKGKRKRMGEPAIFNTFSPSPDGKYLLVEIIHRPYSYLVRYNRFPKSVEIWDLEGNRLRVIADIPLKDNVPTAFGSVPTGPRDFEWRSDAAATLCWAEAQDGGDAKAEAEIRDKLFVQNAPFDQEPKLLATLSQRYGGIEWGSGDLATVYEWWWKTRNLKTWIVKPDAPEAEPVLLWDRSWEDEYGNPGDFVMHSNAYGHDVLTPSADGKGLFLIGDGASPEGNRPFLDRIDLATQVTTRLWRSEAPYYEMPIELLDRTGGKVITRRESRQDPPNYFVRDLGTGELSPLTTFDHPHPQLSGLQKELIHYQRADGVKLTGTLYLPPDYKIEDGPLALLMWAYPQEYKSADAAGQVTDSPHRFDRIGWWSPLVWLTQGYAVLDDPKLPIVGEGDIEPNDTYVEQLVAGAQAAVDEVVRRGVTDPDHIAIGGHSYGAFMAANLLAHCDLFRTGIARSGAYNRTLTPFGFQAEERTVWEAPEVYFKMSPFMHADKVNEPILLIHGKVDNNSGTFPMQSERFYNALKGHGVTARLVMLPHESHGYQARESVLHMLWETHRWMETYVKQAGPRTKGSPETSSTGSEGD